MKDFVPHIPPPFPLFLFSPFFFSFDCVQMGSRQMGVQANPDAKLPCFIISGEEWQTTQPEGEGGNFPNIVQELGDPL